MLDLSRITEFEKVRTEFNKSSIAANTDIFTNNDYVVPYNCIIRIIVALDSTVVFKYKLIRNTTQIIAELNGGNTLTANAVFAFDVAFSKDDKVNFQVSATSGILHLDIYKIGTSV